MTHGYIVYMAIAIFFISYAVIISERVHRTVAAIAGAVAMVGLGVLTQKQAIEGIDFNTLGLLIGMMVIVAIAKECGMFQYMAIWAAKIGKGNPIAIFILLGVITAVFSTFLNNVTTVFLMVPVSFVIANNLKIHPMPFLLSIILLSNIGGAATLIGDPPNILIGSAAGLTFNDFLIHLLPITIVAAGITIIGIFYIYRKKMHTTEEAKKQIQSFNPADAITNKPLLIKSLVTLSLVLVGFLTSSLFHIDVATVALGGAALLLLLTCHDPEEPFKEVEWITIFFFIGLFVLVAGLEHVGVINQLAQVLLDSTNGNITTTSLGILWGAGIASAVIDNIPFVATMIPLIQHIGTISDIPLTPLWWALAMGADFGGNATIIGASANLVVKGLAEKAGYDMGFWKYMKVAAPLTILVLIACTGYVYFRYLI